MCHYAVYGLATYSLGELGAIDVSVLDEVDIKEVIVVLLVPVEFKVVSVVSEDILSVVVPKKIIEVTYLTISTTIQARFSVFTD
jgi:hypothetical protein